MPYKNKSDQAKAARGHYLLHKTDLVRRQAARNAKQRLLLKKVVRNYLSQHPCVDCGEPDIIVLEFDHRVRSEKLIEIANLVRTACNVKKLFDEIAKCDVRCANCHRRKTHAEVWAAGNKALETDNDDQLILF